MVRTQGSPVTGSDRNNHGQSPGNRDFGENLSGNGRDGAEERQYVVVNGLLQDVERDRMEPQVLLLARQRVNLYKGSESEVDKP